MGCLGSQTGRAFACALLAVAVVAPDAARAAQVKGVVDPPYAVSNERAIGYMRMRVASAAPAVATRRADVALFLMVKTSLPLPAPSESEPFKVTISGTRFMPSVAACVIDGKVAFTNDDRTPMTVTIDQQQIGPIAPGETRTFDCTSGGSKLRRMRVKEWPHMRATLAVGEIGVVGHPNANGAFSLTAPQGTYELQILGENGPITTRQVEVTKGDVDVGKISLLPAGEAKSPPAANPTGAAPAQDAAKPAPKPKPAKAATPPPAADADAESEGTEP